MPIAAMSNRVNIVDKVQASLNYSFDYLSQVSQIQNRRYPELCHCCMKAAEFIPLHYDSTHC